MLDVVDLLFIVVVSSSSLFSFFSLVIRFIRFWFVRISKEFIVDLSRMSRSLLIFFYTVVVRFGGRGSMRLILVRAFVNWEVRLMRLLVFCCIFEFRWLKLLVCSTMVVLLLLICDVRVRTVFSSVVSVWLMALIAVVEASFFDESLSLLSALIICFVIFFVIMFMFIAFLVLSLLLKSYWSCYGMVCCCSFVRMFASFFLKGVTSRVGMLVESDVFIFLAMVVMLRSVCILFTRVSMSCCVTGLVFTLEKVFSIFWRYLFVWMVLFILLDESSDLSIFWVFCTKSG